MGSYALSREADKDIEGIAADSVKTWGLARAEAYILALHQAFQRLSEFPDLGRDVSQIRPGYLRMDSGSHAVFSKRAKPAC